MQQEQIIQRIYKLPQVSLNKLLDIVTEVQFPKGHLLMHAEKVERHFYFIMGGLVRAYTQVGDNEITFWFGRIGDPVLSMRSYINRSEGYEDIELLEDSTFMKFSIEQLHALYNEDIHIANWGRKLAEIELVKTEELFISRQFKTASVRYQELIENNPDLIQKVALGHIASYLGITQVSLSRIRSEIK